MKFRNLDVGTRLRGGEGGMWTFVVKRVKSEDIQNASSLAITTSKNHLCTCQYDVTLQSALQIMNDWEVQMQMRQVCYDCCGFCPKSSNIASNIQQQREIFHNMYPVQQRKIQWFEGCARCLLQAINPHVDSLPCHHNVKGGTVACCLHWWHTLVVSNHWIVYTMNGYLRCTVVLDSLCNTAAKWGHLICLASQIKYADISPSPP